MLTWVKDVPDLTIPGYHWACKMSQISAEIVEITGTGKMYRFGVLDPIHSDLFYYYSDKPIELPVYK